jgi:hypothetical protein
MGYMGGEDAPQLCLAQHEQVVQALAAHTPEEALTDRMLFRYAVGGTHLVYAGGVREVREGRTVFAIVVTEEMLGVLAEN